MCPGKKSFYMLLPFPSSFIASQSKAIANMLLRSQKLCVLDIRMCIMFRLLTCACTHTSDIDRIPTMEFKRSPRDASSSDEQPTR